MRRAVLRSDVLRGWRLGVGNRAGEGVISLVVSSRWAPGRWSHSLQRWRACCFSLRKTRGYAVQVSCWSPFAICLPLLAAAQITVGSVLSQISYLLLAVPLAFAVVVPLRPISAVLGLSPSLIWVVPAVVGAVALATGSVVAQHLCPKLSPRCRRHARTASWSPW